MKRLKKKRRQGDGEERERGYRRRVNRGIGKRGKAWWRRRR